jgi:HEAT repeat protein
MTMPRPIRLALGVTLALSVGLGWGWYRQARERASASRSPAPAAPERARVVAKAAAPAPAALPLLLQAQRTLDTLHAGLTRLEGYVGVEVQDPIAGEGITIVRTVAGTPAATAGLRAGDAIAAADQVPVTTVAKLAEYVRGQGAGKRLALTVKRAGKALEVTLDLGERPGAVGDAPPVNPAKARRDVTAAVEQLAAGGPASLPVLRGMVTDGQRGASDRIVALLAAGRIDQKAAAQTAAALAANEEDADPSARALALFQLADWDREAGATRALDLLEHRQLDLRLAAAGVLRATADPRAIPRLRALLDDPTPLGRAVAGEVLAAVGDAAQVAPLLERQLADASPLVRLSALRQLAGLGTTDYSGFVPSNQETWAMLNGPQLVPAGLAPASASPRLPAMGVDRLIRFLEDPSDAVAATAAAALCQLLDQDRGQSEIPGALLDALAQLERPISTVRKTELLALAQQIQREVVQDQVTNAAHVEQVTEQLLVARTSDPDRLVASRAIEALGMYGSDRSAARLAELTLDPNAAGELRQTAAEALGAPANGGTKEGRERLLSRIVAGLSPQRDFDLWSQAVLSLGKNYRMAPYYEESLVRSWIEVLEHPGVAPGAAEAALELLSGASSPLAKRAVLRHRKTRGILV